MLPQLWIYCRVIAKWIAHAALFVILEFAFLLFRQTFSCFFDEATQRQAACTIYFTMTLCSIQSCGISGLSYKWGPPFSAAWCQDLPDGIEPDLFMEWTTKRVNTFCPKGIDRCECVQAPGNTGNLLNTLPRFCEYDVKQLRFPTCSK